MEKLCVAVIAAMLTACSKQQPVERHRCMTVTNYISHCDEKWRPLDTIIAIQWPSVCDDELKRFEATKKDSSNCPSNAISWIEIYPIK